MVRSLDHSIDVQIRRHQSGKIGLAAAIRRYLHREHRKDYRKLKQKIIAAAWRYAEAA